MEKRWILPEKYDIPEVFIASIGGDPLIAETLYRRGIQTIEAARGFLNPEAYTPCDPGELPDSQIAWELLMDALVKQDRILIWGDFDVDGQTATTLLVEGMKELGGNIDYHIPIRAEESHGITRRVLSGHLAQGFDLLLTCDTGITEHENINLLRQKDKAVIVTDHHSLGVTLPPANAIVNPQRLKTSHPLRTLPGVGVVYKLMEGLFSAMGKPFDADHYLELAALGIVADVAELRGDTRYLLQRGLKSLQRTKRIGLKEIYQNAGLNPAHLTEDHIGFQIGPRLNAVGRLADANPMVELLTTNDAGRARVLAAQIEAFNAKRRFATRQVEKAAEAKLAASPEERMSPAIVLHHPGWPGGVVGIVASRLVERYQKPVILLTGRDPSHIAHGSARSVDGVHITEVIATQSDLLTSFGGHPMAAGLALPAENLNEFKHGFNEAVRKQQERAEVIPEIKISRQLALKQISFDLIEQIERLAPFGPGNPPLYFLLRDLSLVSYSELGRPAEHRQVIVSDGEETTQRFIWWKGADEPLPEAQFDLVCKLSQSDYKGERQISAEWIDYRLSETGLQVLKNRKLEWIDLRQSLSPGKDLKKLLEENPDVQVWVEGGAIEGVQGKGRRELSPCDHLVIWTTPPSQSVLEEVLLNIQPQKVTVFALDPMQMSPKTTLTQLGGMAKYAIQNKQGKATLNDFASACAVDIQTVEIALKFWEAKGAIKVDQDGQELRITQVNSPPNQASIEIYQSILHDLSSESSAFRRYFKTSEIQKPYPMHSDKYP